MLRLVSLFALFATGLAAPAIAAEDGAKPPAEKKICRRSTPTGSNLPRSVCRTKAEWAASDEAKRKGDIGRDLDEVRNRASGGFGG